MQVNDETTGNKLVSTVNQIGASISTTTALKGRRLLGWTRRGTAYCQLIRAPNCSKRLEGAQQNLGGTFKDIIWTDETSVQMETHRSFHYKKGQNPGYKPRPKHPVKAHVCAGISCRGPTGVWSTVLWTLQCIPTYSTSTLFYSYELCIQLGINSCKTMILNTLHAMHRPSLQKSQSIGGKLHQRALMQTRLKTCGTN
jgi:hypothetical protein